MKKKNYIPFPCVFRGKKSHTRVQGIMTTRGGQAFEAARRRLKQIIKPFASCAAVKRVSDGDVFEFLARGEADTVRYLMKVNK